MALFLFEGAQRVAPFYHKVLPHPKNVLGLLMKENLIGTRAFLSKRLQRVAPFYHPSTYQFSTLEKTKLCHHPTLSSVLSTRHGRQRITPFDHFSQLSHSRGSNFHSLSSPGFLTPKMTELREPLQSRLIIGLDFAVTLSSPECCWTLFAIPSEQTVELKMANVEQTQKMISFVTCEISLG